MNALIIFVVIGLVIVMAALLWYGNYTGFIQTRPGGGVGLQPETPPEEAEIPADSGAEDLPAPLASEKTPAPCAEDCQQSCQDFSQPADVAACQAECLTFCADF